MVEVLLVGIETSHSMGYRYRGHTRFVEALSLARVLGSKVILYGYNVDWFILDRSAEKTPLKGSGLLRAGLRGALELAPRIGLKRVILIGDGVGEPRLPMEEAEALADAGVKVDIIFVGDDKEEFHHLKSVAAVSGGKAIDASGEEAEAPGEEAVISLEAPAEGEEKEEKEKDLKDILRQIKEKVW